MQPAEAGGGRGDLRTVTGAEEDAAGPRGDTGLQIDRFHQPVEPLGGQVLKGPVAVVAADDPVVGIDHSDLAQPRPLEQCVEELDTELADHGGAFAARYVRSPDDHRLLAVVVDDGDLHLGPRLLPVLSLGVGARILARPGRHSAVGVQHVQGPVARVLGHGPVQEGAHPAGRGVVVDERGYRGEVGVALVERAADPVGERIGALALVVDDLLRDGGRAVGAVEQEAQRHGPGQQEAGAEGQQAAGADAAQQTGAGDAARAGRLGRCGRRVGGRTAWLVRPRSRPFAEQLAAQALQGPADPGRFAVPGDAHRPCEVAPGEAAALQEEPEQRPLDGAQQQRDGQYTDENERGRGEQAEQRVGGGPGLLGHRNHRDHRQAEAGDGGALLGVRGGEGGVAGDGLLPRVGVAGQASADTGEAALAEILGRDRWLCRLDRGSAGERLQLPLGAVDVLALEGGQHLLGLRDAVAAEDRALRVDDGDGTERAQADAGHLQAAGGDQELLGSALPGEQGEREQPGLAVAQPYRARGEAVVSGELLPVDRRQRQRFAACGAQLAGGDVDDGHPAPLVVGVAERVQDLVRLGRGPRGGECGGALDIGDALVQ
ncbi:hypothetical protein [Streptomyces pinistramenti]|uniref:hypothetical protein n=1 Tax=Streptomyces pinistramenti TaxID=2884812 RepID=UPI001D08A137|nr:hypothetical protein [Streptomyces pinistramenti]MCB5910916.1 hypothetical protein [Streptomyces pinistramenti]